MSQLFLGVLEVVESDIYYYIKSFYMFLKEILHFIKFSLFSQSSVHIIFQTNGLIFRSTQ